VKVQFEFSAADLAEVASRTVDRSALIQKWRRLGRWLWAVVCGLIVFLFTPAAELALRITASVIVGVVVFAFLAWRAKQRKGRSRLLEFYRERLGSDGPFPCEVEIDSTGLVARQFGAELRHPWAQIESISDTPGSIEFVYRPMGSLLVRDRAFASREIRAEFLKLARGYHAQAPKLAA
jgi:hypothetical protein